MGVLDSLFALFVGSGLLNSDSLSPSSLSSSGLSIDEGAPFLLQVVAKSPYARRHVTKRESSLFVTTSGQTSPACQLAEPFTLVGDQLVLSGNVPVTADPTAACQPFTSFNGSNSISGGFSVNADGTLHWSSSNFSLGNASFCITKANVVYAVFAAGGTPKDCTTVNLQCVPASTCPLPISISGPTAVNINIYNTQNNYYGGAGSSGDGGNGGGSSSSGSTSSGSGVPSVPSVPSVPGVPGVPGASSNSYASAYASAGSESSSSSPDVVVVEGQPGPAGANGQNGDNGEAGQDGKDGSNGTNGTDGAPGPAGPAGPEGPQGPQGPQGPYGYNGTNGMDGINGTSYPSSNSSGNGGTYGGYGYTGCWVVHRETLGGNPVLATEVITESIDECASFCSTANGGRNSLYFTLSSRPSQPGDSDSDTVESVCTCTNSFQGSAITSTTTYACNTPCTFSNADGSTAYCGAYRGGFYFASVFTAL
ncbi:hypothetical protein Sste5346_005445 [Sporothrix stenoceras]|uniref:DUF7908 domain-containing protein n=1 Tax=Sporothrix stenoceras TaxID=5173 RepID=A0ABR3Z3Y7_9PEZI